MPTNGLAPQIEAHEDRLQRVEAGVADLRVSVGVVSTKLDLNHQLVMNKLEDLAEEDEEVKADVKKLKKHEGSGKLESMWEMLPLKILRRYSIHILTVGSGALIHWVYTLWQHAH